ncbi:MAG: diguanylate cyclase [Myxococcales bacterium]|nr:diguanylate cyclase [Myxococcota bacterium]MDW8280085.1 diguanylate cyclase [Myxococcales bacterium]
MQRDHIICVDDEEGVLTALRQQLGARFGEDCEIDLARSGRDALELIDELMREGESVAIVVADQIMPGMKGVELLIEVHKRLPKTAKVLLTGQAGLDAVILAINHAGLSRYLPKPWEEPDLRLTIESLLSNYRLQRHNERLLISLQEQNMKLEALNLGLEQKVRERTRALEEANRRLAELAITDGLTGLNNHRYLQEQLVLEVERSLRTAVPLGMLMVDVDHFRLYNNRFGHPVGDEVLRRVARLISEHRRVNDVVARYGGEEFALLLINADHRVAAHIAERLRQRVQAEPFPQAQEMPGGRLTISIGVASCPADGTTPAGLLAAADAALFRAKHAGRNTVRIAGEPDPPVFEALGT